MTIRKYRGTIGRINNLSPTAKEVWLQLSEPIDFSPGSFVNVFMDIDGTRVRRAYSISSSPLLNNEISLTVRLSPNGTMTPLFWKQNLNGSVLELMGPLGLNTAETMLQKKIFLFAFGVGAGVVKSLAEHFSADESRELTIMTGSRSVNEILYREYFDSLGAADRICVRHVVSGNTAAFPLYNGYIQDHISNLDFNNSDVYACGQEKACDDLVKKIQSKKPVNCSFHIEGFH